MKIFNHDITLSTHDTEPGTHLYSGRALGLSNPEDKVQIHPELASEWDVIAAHYAQIGLTHSHDVVWDVSLAATSQYTSLDYEPCVYFFGDAVNYHDAYRGFFQQYDPQWCQVVDFVNSKNNFIYLAEELGIAVPKTLRFNNLAAAQMYDGIPFPCYVKQAISDHGCGIRRCQNQQELTEVFSYLPPDEPLQIQAEVQASTFLNLQYRITANGVEPLLASEQILKGCVHLGNRFPSRHQPWDVVQPFAEWISDRGMKGIFAVDVAVVPEADGISYLAIECNPRFNGSSYPTLVAQKLEIPSWSSTTYKTSKRSLQDVSLTDIAFNPATGQGIILVNWGTIKVGKLSVLLAGSPAEQTELGNELKSRLQRQLVLQR